LHPKNLHNNPYRFDQLIDINPDLSKFVFINDFGTQTIDFSIQEAVLLLNKALLKRHYGVTDWEIPPHYLCPAEPIISTTFPIYFQKKTLRVQLTDLTLVLALTASTPF